MKATVIKTFRDKLTKAVRRKGDVVEVTLERFEEVNSAAQGPFLAVEEPSGEQKQEGPPETEKPAEEQKPQRRKSTKAGD